MASKGLQKKYKFQHQSIKGWRHAVAQLQSMNDTERKNTKKIDTVSKTISRGRNIQYPQYPQEEIWMSNKFEELRAKSWLVSTRLLCIVALQKYPNICGSVDATRKRKLLFDYGKSGGRIEKELVFVAQTLVQLYFS